MKTLRQNGLAWLAVLGAVLWIFHRWLTNQFTPGSDGWRIFLRTDFLQNSNQFFPFWNPYTQGGIPTLADAERLGWLSVFVDTSSPHFNLNLNLCLMTLAALFGWTAYGLARELSMKRPGACVTAVTLLCSQYYVCAFESGRISDLVVFPVIQAAAILYLRFRKQGQLAAGLTLVLLSGFVLAEFVYYTLPYFTAFLVLIDLSVDERCRIKLGSVLKSAGRAVTVTAVGGGLWAVFILPLIYYNFGSHLDIAPRDTLSNTLPAISSLANIGLPLDLSSTRYFDQQIFPFFSLLLFPALAVLLASPEILKQRTARVFGFASLLCLPVLLGKIFPFSLLVELAEALPILQNIRHTLPFHHLLTFTFAILCGLAVDGLQQLPVHRRRYLLLLLIGPAVYALYFAFTPDGVTTTSLLAMPGIVLPVALLPRHWMRQGGFALLFLFQVLIFRPETPVRPVSNRLVTPNIQTFLEEDDSFYGVMEPQREELESTASALGLVGTLDVPNFEAFTFHFSPQHRLAAEMLFRQPVETLRYHWFRKPPYPEWNLQALDMLNIKYMIHRGNKRVGWRRMAEDPPYSLWLKMGWESSLRLIHRWEVLEVTRHRESMADPEVLALRKVLLADDPGLTLPPPGHTPKTTLKVARPSSDELLFEVSTDSDAVLFIPEYYDSGWKGLLDGQPVPVIQTNAIFRAVPIPAGNHRLKIYYRPQTLLLGTLISVLTLLAASVWMWQFKKRWRDREGVLA